MLAYVDIQHPRIAEDPEKGPIHRAAREQQRRRIEEATGVPCRLIRYNQLDPGDVRSGRIQGILISGCSFDWAEYDWPSFDPLQEIIRSGEVPTLGFCGGHQLIAMTLGGACAPVGPLAAGVPDPDPSVAPGMIKEKGILPVRVVLDDPLFDGLPRSFDVWQSHYWDVKELPPGFERLAESDVCPVQAMRHRDKPWYGTQFHPERYESAFPAGATILRNFAKQL
jgi:GMP synthase-like glutamine amidotransferase